MALSYWFITNRIPRKPYASAPFLGLELIYLQAMHAGVIRDMEQQKVKKERQADFEMQRALEEEYRKVQSVHDGDKGKVG